MVPKPFLKYDTGPCGLAYPAGIIDRKNSRWPEAEQAYENGGYHVIGRSRSCHHRPCRYRLCDLKYTRMKGIMLSRGLGPANTFHVATGCVT